MGNSFGEDNSTKKRPFKAPSEHKIIILGDNGVGKTSISTRFQKNVFNESDNEKGALYYTTNVRLKTGTFITLGVSDIKFDDKYRSLIAKWCAEADGALLVYDISKPETFENIEHWLKIFKEDNSKDNVVLHLVGNKKDLGSSARAIPADAAEQFAMNSGMAFSEVSAKTGEGVTEIFDFFSEEIANRNTKAIPVK